MTEFILILELFFFSPGMDFSVNQTRESLHYSQTQCELALESAVDEWQKKYLKDDEIAPFGIMARCVEV